jgi:hypothetical protein
MPLGMQRIGHLMAAYSDRFGDPRGTLTISVPATVSRAGTPFNVRASDFPVVHTFQDVRGGWAAQREDNVEGRGRSDERAIQLIFFPKKHDRSEAELRALLGAPGAVVTWEGMNCSVAQVLKDEYQDALVINLLRAGPLPAGPAVE